MDNKLTSQLQLRAFELDLRGFELNEINIQLKAKFNLPMDIDTKYIQTLIDAETILYSIASISQESNGLQELHAICVWPDYEYCLADDLEEFGANKSDDYIKAHATLDNMGLVSDDTIHRIANGEFTFNLN